MFHVIVLKLELACNHSKPGKIEIRPKTNPTWRQQQQFFVCWLFIRPGYLLSWAKQSVIPEMDWNELWTLQSSMWLCGVDENYTFSGSRTICPINKSISREHARPMDGGWIQHPTVISTTHPDSCVGSWCRHPQPVSVWILVKSGQRDINNNLFRAEILSKQMLLLLLLMVLLQM